MAARRMFAKSIIGSARFLRMPASSRLLYYDLGMDADDDGVVEAFSVIRKTGASEDDLKMLVAKQFVTVLNDDLVTYIRDWKRNNLIKKDRYHPSIYAMLIPDEEPTWNPSGTRMEPEERKGEERLGKVSEEKERGGAPPAVISFFEEEISKNAADPVKREIADACNLVGEEMVMEAMRTAVQQNKRSWGYCKGILNNWQKQGHRPFKSNALVPGRTLTEAEQEEQAQRIAKNHEQLQALLAQYGGDQTG